MRYKLNGANQTSYDGTKIQSGEILELADDKGVLSFGGLRYYVMKLLGIHIYRRCSAGGYVTFHDTIIERYFVKIG